MTVNSKADLAGLKRIGRIVGLAIQEIARHIAPGITTRELDELGRKFLESHGARSAPRLVYQFPGTTCISLNDEAAHGIPGSRIVQAGDLVNIDVSAELDGYFADSAITVPVPPVAPLQEKLLACARTATQKAIASARAGQPINLIGLAAQREAERCGFTIIRNLPGHGVGRNLHEDPTVLNFYAPKYRQRLSRGLVITIEPFVSNGAQWVVEQPNGWTLKTPDGSLSAQFEHTIVVTNGRPLVVTAV